MEITEKTTAKEMLNLIDDFFVVADDRDSKDLWDVLTALRGPDSPNSHPDLKRAITVNIRRKAFPKALKNKSAIIKMVNFGYPLKLILSKIPPGHFQNHIMDAAIALGMKMNP